MEIGLIEGIGVAAVVLVGREFGFICLPKFNIIPAALGMTVDVLLDIFLLARTGMLFIKRDTANNGNEAMLLLSSLALFVWNMVTSINA
jgi:hypothetical protein